MIQCDKCGKPCGTRHPVSHLGERYLCDNCFAEQNKFINLILIYVGLPWAALIGGFWAAAKAMIVVKDYLLSVGASADVSMWGSLGVFAIIGLALLFLMYLLIWPRLTTGKRVAVCILCPPYLVVALLAFIFWGFGKLKRSK